MPSISPAETKLHIITNQQIRHSDLTIHWNCGRATADRNSISNVSQIRKRAAGEHFPDGGQAETANKLPGHVKDLLIKINLLIVYLDYAKSLSENSKTPWMGGYRSNRAAQKARDASGKSSEEAKEQQMGLKLFHFLKPARLPELPTRVMGTGATDEAKDDGWKRYMGHE